MDDEGIIALFFSRSEQALSETRNRYGRMIRRIAGNLLPSAEDVEECENDTYLGLWNAIPPEHPDPFAAYIARIARNNALSRRRYTAAEKRRGDAYALSLEELEEILPSSSPEDLVSSRELGRSIDRFLSSVNSDARVLFLRRYWFGDSVQTLAKEFGIGENAVSARLSRLRKRLKTFLEQEGFTV